MTESLLVVWSQRGWNYVYYWWQTPGRQAGRPIALLSNHDSILLYSLYVSLLGTGGWFVSVFYIWLDDMKTSRLFPDYTAALSSYWSSELDAENNKQVRVKTVVMDAGRQLKPKKFKLIASEYNRKKKHSPSVLNVLLWHGSSIVSSCQSNLNPHYFVFRLACRCLKLNANYN